MSHTAHPHQTALDFTDPRDPDPHGRYRDVEQVEWAASMILADETADPAEVAAANDLMAVCRLARRELNRLCRNGTCDQVRTYGDFCQRCDADVYWDGGPF